MIKEKRAKAELEAMIEMELNDPRANVSVEPDPIGWDNNTTIHGDNSPSLVIKAKQIADRLCDQYDLKEE